MELDRIRNSSTTKTNQLTRTEKSFHSNFTEEDQTGLPCEFCNHPFPACDLIRHQVELSRDINFLYFLYIRFCTLMLNNLIFRLVVDQICYHCLIHTPSSQRKSKIR